MPRPVHAAALVAALSLASCGPLGAGPAVPDTAFLQQGRLAVYFKNGVVCRADVTTSLSGEFVDCPNPARYDVRLLSPGLLSGAVPIFEPHADITITQPDGRVTLLKTPGSRNWKGIGSMKRD